MQVRIHRGSHEVGGSCIEVEHDGERIVIDLGLPLDSDIRDEGHLPHVSGFDGQDKSLVGVLVSHPHPDHHGLIPRLDPSVPVYIGAGAERIVNEAAFFFRDASRIGAHGHIVDREVLSLGPFSVTPLIMDHSGFDAYALLIEAGGRRLLYSGDIRAHGRKKWAFERFVSDPPQDVNALFLEGTHVRRGSQPATTVTEEAVETQAIETMRSTAGIALLCYSPQNVDRLVSLFRSAKRAGRVFVMDLYAATIAQATGRLNTIPQAAWDGVRVHVPNSQRIMVKRQKAFERVIRLGRARIYAAELASTPVRFAMSFRGSMGAELDRSRCLKGASAIWSMWAGYLERPDGLELQKWLTAHDIPLRQIHASGHAAVGDLQRFAAAVDAHAVIPIHTSAPERFDELFDNVTRHEDGEWWVV